MKSFCRANAVVVVMWLLAGFHLPAQTTAFTYQGFLTEFGAPANGTSDFEFRLYDAASAGAQQGGTVLKDDVGVSNGLFTVTLDFGAGVFDGSALWLDIAVRPGASGGAYTNVVPRQPITATPFAVRAGNYSGTVAASQLTGTISQNNIGSGTITSTMLVNGAVTSSKLATGAVTTATLANGAVNLVKLQTQTTSSLLNVITNPSPTTDDRFGRSVALMGNRLLIGAFSDDTGAADAGAAYLFNANGELLTTFTNPAPDAGDFFGFAVAAVGDLVLIGASLGDEGASDAGGAYLFDTNGTLITTFTNPTPAAGDRFGRTLAAVGTDRVIIGAEQDGAGAPNMGAAYLFSTNGTLLTTFGGVAAAGDRFGSAVAALGNDRVVIGAFLANVSFTDSGVAFLFRTDGTLLTTFNNPFPGPFGIEQFGLSIATVGADGVLIGSALKDTFGANAGAAYLFNTNGVLLQSFYSPSPAVEDRFGQSVASLGSDRILIGSPFKDVGATDAGAVYLFSTNGTLQATFTNPAPITDANFGRAIAASSNRILIGADIDEVNATTMGVGYQFTVDLPHLPGLAAEQVLEGGITSSQLAAGAVTAAKLDSTIGIWTRSGNNVYRTNGNVGIGTTNPTNKLDVVGDVSAASFITTSDRNAKQNFRPISPGEVLSKVVALPIQTWNFKTDIGTTHVGPMAQDFYAAFGVGPDNRHIATVDADGVALAAIQGLNQKLEETRAENAELKQRLEALERVLIRLNTAPRKE